ncbi:uncharacterized protein LOC134180096 isoform X2 [Corticium candelabrum]|uniref:uncharacterized protein LOC134180096 isoform X2 n=1 Tax=Corticium candelabrum TaxID=121492 RepID=UPI002E25A364|nr:uncharacterized protein LOC134180096 isoform X2 [Corticium candelabrum]
MSLDDPLVSEAIRTIADGINRRRADVVHTVITTVAENSSSGGGSVTPLQVVLDHVDDKTGTSLHHATKAGCVDIVRTLLASGANPCIRDKQNKTAYDLVPNEQMRNIYVSELMQATAHDGQLEHVKQLLAVGVDVNARDGSEKANTALHFAASYANADMINCLCEHGADTTVLNGEGLTPLQDAMKRGDSSIIKALVEYDIRQRRSQPAVNQSSPAVSAVSESGHLQREASTTLTVTVDSSSSSHEGSANGNVSTCSLSDLLDENGSCDSSVYVWPPPQIVIRRNDGMFTLSSTLKVYINSCQASLISIVQVWKRAEAWFQQINVDVQLDSQYHSGETVVSCAVQAELFAHRESYKLTVFSDKVMLTASDLAGLWYGIHTLIQLCRNCRKKSISIPTVHISDWPCLAVRGVMIDLSDGRSPDLDTLMGIVDILSTVYKVNRLQLRIANCEKTKPSGGTELVQLYSSKDILALTDYCNNEFIELVPHFEDNDSDSTFLLPSVQSLVSNSSSDVTHSSANHFVSPSFSTRQYWLTGTESERDIEELVASGRGVGVVRLQEVRDKAQQVCSHLTETGLSFMIATDTSVRHSVCYNWEQCLSDAYLTASLALQFACPGILITDSSDRHCIAPLAITVSAMAIGAGFAWTGPLQQAKFENCLISTLNRQIFLDVSNSIGQCIVVMAKTAGLWTDHTSGHCTVPYLLLTDPSAVQVCVLSPENVQVFLRAVRRCHKWSADFKLQCFQDEASRREVILILELITHSSKVAKAIVQNCGENASSQHVDLRQLPATQRTDLANKLLGLIDSIRSTGRLRNQDVVGREQGCVMLQLQQVADGLV